MTGKREPPGVSHDGDPRNLHVTRPRLDCLKFIPDRGLALPRRSTKPLTDSVAVVCRVIIGLTWTSPHGGIPSD
jgi:hypothetical protein